MDITSKLQVMAAMWESLVEEMMKERDIDAIEKALQFNVKMEELLSARIEDLLSPPDNYVPTTYSTYYDHDIDCMDMSDPQ